MNLGLSFTKKLQDADHWELIKSLSNEVHDVSVDINDIHDSLNGRGISEARTSLARTLARVEVLKEIVRMKLSIMDDEWDLILKSQLKEIEEELTEVDTPPPFNIEGLI